MNILIIGSGAREHALARAAARSEHKPKLFCYGTGVNPGIKKLCQAYKVGDICLVDNVVAFAKSTLTMLAIVGPEAALAAGVADALWQADIPTIGPKKILAQIETSKAFTRDLATKYTIPGGPDYKVFDSLEGADKFLNKLKGHYVIKANGLMGGKGVKVAGEHLQNHQEALQFCQQILEKGQGFVIEEKCVGPEFSLLSFSDGKHLAHMPPVQDHKRAFVGDVGPNTGGMGSYSCANHLLPFIDEADVKAAQKINELAIAALYEEYGQPYVGIIYGGYMATKDSVKLIEFNARFGDPEAMNLLALLESDFVELCQAMVEGNLSQDMALFSPKASVCKYAVPDGYPDTPVKGEAVDLGVVREAGQLYLAAVDESDGVLYATGSRTVAALGIDESLSKAEQQAEEMIAQIQGPVFHRRDIGTSGLINERVKLINDIRGSHFPLLED